MPKIIKKDILRAVSLLKKLYALTIVKFALIIAVFIPLAPFLLFLFLRPKIQQDINYGVTFSKKYAHQLGLNWKDSYIKILDDLGAKNIRLIVYWDETEKENNVYDFSDIKWQLTEAETRSIPVILTLGRKVPRWPECAEPQWWKELDNEKQRNAELYEFLQKVISELKAYKNISMWQVENEPFFPFGDCEFPIRMHVVRNEIGIVKDLDDRPILVQDSGEGGVWFPSYKLGDYLAISMYRKIWYDFWGIFFGEFIYFKYPLAHWTYKIKADLVRVPYQKIIVTELQAEPWGPRINSELADEEKDKSMSRNDFLSTISYAQKAGFKDLYFWGVEWWLWEKEVNTNPFYWDTAKALFK